MSPPSWSEPLLYSEFSNQAINETPGSNNTRVERGAQRAGYLAMKGSAGKVQRRLASYLRRFHGNQRFSWLFGRYIEMRGNIVSIDGLSFSVDNPAVSTKMKRHFLFDLYEQPEREAIKRWLDSSAPVIEFGGSIGVVSCLTNTRLDNPRAHVVVEANSELIPLLEQNRLRNGCQFIVLHRALGYRGDSISFQINADFWASNTSIDTGKTVSVATISLAEIVATYRFERCTVICDTEGAEVDLVNHEPDILREKVSTFILEVHPWCVDSTTISSMLKKLDEIGFVLRHRNDQNLVYANSGMASKAAG